MAKNDPLVVGLHLASNYNLALVIVLVMFGVFVALFIAINAWVNLPTDDDSPCERWRLVAVGAGIWLVLAILPAAYYGGLVAILPAIMGWGLFRTLYESRINESRSRATLPQGVKHPRRIWIPLMEGEVKDLRYMAFFGVFNLGVIAAFGLLLLNPASVPFKVLIGTALVGLIPFFQTMKAVWRRESFEEIKKKAPKPRQPGRGRRQNPPVPATTTGP